MDYIDTHAHLNFQAYKKDVDEVIRRALDSKIAMIIPSTDQTTSKRAIEIANKYETGVYATIGLHPVHLQNQEFEEEGQKIKMKSERFDKEFYERIASNKKVVAIGEVGLDYHYLPREKPEENKELQKQTLIFQLELAHELNLPTIIHCREAHDDLVILLKDFYKNKPSLAYGRAGRGVLHCFSGDWELAWKYFELGFLISFTGLITFNNQWDELIRKVPLDKIMIETDSPFMSPENYRGKRNEPSYVVEVAKKISEIKKVSLTKVAQVTTDNAKKLFNI